MNQQTKPRHANIRPTDSRAGMMASLRCKGVEVAALEVLDLSLAGCMFATDRWRAKEQQRVLVSLPGIANLPGQVLWVEGGRAGVLFDQLLSEMVYEHLVQSFALNRG